MIVIGMGPPATVLVEEAVVEMVGAPVTTLEFCPLTKPVIWSESVGTGGTVDHRRLFAVTVNGAGLTVRGALPNAVNE